MNATELKAEREVIDNTIAFVKETLKDAEGGHDWFHIQRVYNNAKMIAKGERLTSSSFGNNLNMLVVRLGALLHDIADAKFHQGDESIGPRKARAFLESQDGVSEDVIAHVEKIIQYISFKSSLKSKKDEEEGTQHQPPFTSPELKVVQDADRLDAMGAIGIARCFNYGGFQNRALYDPDIPPRDHGGATTKDEYQASTAPTINHFHEKLLLLKDKMNTPTGRRIATDRHAYMEGFLQQFEDEWNGRK